MALTGSLLDFNAADILQLIKLQQKDGVLEVRDRDRRLCLSFFAGDVVAAERSGGRVGQVLRKRLERDGDLPEAAWSEIDKGLKAGQPIDTLLLAAGIPAEHIADLLDDYLRDAVLALFTWSEGTYRFEVRPPRTMPVAQGPVALNTSSLLMDVATRMGPVMVLGEQLGGLDAVFRPLAKVPPGTDNDWLWPWLNGRRNLRDVIDVGNGGVLATLTALKDLSDAGLIKSVAVSPEMDPAPRPSLPVRRRRYGHRAAGILVSALCGVLVVGCVWLFVSAPSGASTGTAGEVMASTWSYRDHKVRQALTAYRMVHGHYPETLFGLTRKGLIGDPDIFTGMNYLKSGKGYTLHAS